MILGLVLGVICESNLRRAYTIVAGDTLMEATINILTRPVTDHHPDLYPCFVEPRVQASAQKA